MTLKQVGRAAKAKRVEARTKPSKVMQKVEANVPRKHQMVVQSATGTTTRKRSPDLRSATSSVCAVSVLGSTLSILAQLVDQRQIPFQID
jgi:hypothetical protein